MTFRLHSSLLAVAATAAFLAPVAASHAAAEPTAPGDGTPVANDTGQLAATSLIYPGTRPGAATADLTGDTLTFSNAALTAIFTGLDGSDAHLASVSGESGDLGITSSDLFRIILGDGTVLSPATMTVTSGPALTELTGDPAAVRMSEQEDGQQANITYSYTRDGYDLTVQWQSVLRDDANNLQQELVVTNNAAAPADITTLELLNLTAEDARVVGNVDGSPVTFGPKGAEVAFAGVEHPMATTNVDGDHIVAGIDRSSDLEPGLAWRYGSSIGVTPPGQLRRAFTYYVERERAHARRSYLHYQTWFDLKPPGLVIDSSELNEAIELFGTELTERGATIDSFWVDDGWDYLRAPAVADESGLQVWDFDPTQFPDGFAPQARRAAEFGASVSVWMSPFGGYGTSASRRQQLNASKPESEQLETHGEAGFKLSGDKYYQRFRSVVVDMLDNQGVQGFKFDGIGGGLFQTGANPAYIEDYEALLQLMTEMREHSSDVFINATVGTWHSPYWLWYADSIWRDGEDVSQTGAGNARQQYINYRDATTYRHTVATTPLFPLSALMNHGFIFSERTSQMDTNNDLSDPEVRRNVAADMRNYFAMGLSLQELYVRHTEVEPDQPGADWFWDTLARNARWARENLNLLTDVHWVGGDPALGDVYGTAAWQDTGDSERAMIMLRNPGPRPQSIAIDVEDALDLPDGAHGSYVFTSRDGLYEDFVAQAGTEYHLQLEPFQVLLLEGTPSDAEPAP